MTDGPNIDIPCVTNITLAQTISLSGGACKSLTFKRLPNPTASYIDCMVKFEAEAGKNLQMQITKFNRTVRIVSRRDYINVQISRMGKIPGQICKVLGQWGSKDKS